MSSAGLSNLGNTCFMNACLQVLFHTPGLSSLLDTPSFQQRIKVCAESALLLEWDELRKLMAQTKTVVSPDRFLHAVQQYAREKGRMNFVGFDQNDLPEFFLLLIESFHMAVSRNVKMTVQGKPVDDKDVLAAQCFQMVKRMYEKDYSEIWNLFYGIHVSSVRHAQTGKVLSCVPEPFCILQLPLPAENKTATLLECLDVYVRSERMEGSNAYFEETTGQRITADKTLSFWSFPNVLVIELKRYNHSNRKNQAFVTFPLVDLDLSKYSVGYNKETFRYDLYGICNHSGSTAGGHYTSFVRNTAGAWHLYNDTVVTTVENLTQLITPKAYCLFYKKKMQSKN